MVRNANESYYDLQEAMKALQQKQMGQTHAPIRAGGTSGHNHRDACSEHQAEGDRVRPEGPL